MNRFIDKLFIKRFCLPYDTNVEIYEKGYMNVSSCLCGDFNHISCVLKGNNDFEEG